MLSENRPDDQPPANGQPGSASPMMSRRALLKRSFALALAAPAVVTLLSACGEDDEEDPTATTAATEPTGTAAGGASTPTEAMEESTPTEAMEEPTATAEEGEGETPEAESTPEGQFPVTVVEVTDEYRVVQDAFGEVQVPLNPERIIVMDEPTLDTVLSFGITPVGTLMRNGEFPPYILDRLEGVESIGEMNTAFNLETIISLEPDLILVADFWEPELYDQLREIAPTVSWPAWADPIVTTQVVGVILGREDEAEEIIAAYEEKVANARAALDEAIGDQPVAVMRFFAGQVEMPPGEGTNFFYNDLGLTPTQFNSGTEFVYPSLEVMPEINAEYIFFYNEDEAIFDEITNDPLWQTIPAVQNDQVYLVHWSFDNSALLGREILTEQILSDLGVEA